MDIKVIKTDGSIEDFNAHKIALVTQAAGLTPEQAIKLADKVANWAKDKNQPQIKTSEIRTKVIEELKKLNPYAANLYVWYKKTQDLETKKHHRKI